nr:RNA-binding domain-containing protein [Ruegeria sp. R14_0]
MQPLVDNPREDLGAEYKTWLSLSENQGRATLAKAAIAMANHGGGFIIIGFDEQGENLVSVQKPDDMPDLTQDMVNNAIQRYSDPAFHCEVHFLDCGLTGTVHPVVCVPGGFTQPVMSKRESQGVINLHRCYIRKPGPRSQEPQTSEDWRILIDRCVRAGREDMLDAIRNIVSGRVDPPADTPDVMAQLAEFSNDAHQRWLSLTGDMPPEEPARFPHGFYEMGFAMSGSEPAPNLTTIQDRLSNARRVQMTGWGPFLSMPRREWHPYPHDGKIEAWLGNPVAGRDVSPEPGHCDFWRASQDGMLYTIRGYTEDGLGDRVPPGRATDVALPVWRVGEAVYFASRFADKFEGASSIAIRVRFTGLLDRTLTSISNRRLMMDYRTSRTPEVVLETVASVEQLRDNMVEIIHQLLSPFYEVFGFFELSPQLVDQELTRMREGRG